MSSFLPKYGSSRSRPEAGPSRAMRNTLQGTTAYQREKNMARTYGISSSNSTSLHRGKTEFDVLKENMRFIREGEDPKEVRWEDRLARAYESKLFKEFALIDLKHYKTKRIALRWRTAEEVVNAIGEETCGSLRCAYHNPLPDRLVAEGAQMPPLQAFELPFTYAEAGETKTALVKVKVCNRCSKKLLFKPDSNGHSKDMQARDSTDKRPLKGEGSPRDQKERVSHGDREENRSAKRRRSRSPRRHESSAHDTDRRARNRIDH